MSKSVFIVDDSPTVRKLLSLTLKFRGYNVIGAANGKDAWGILQKDKFDIAVIDIIMPIMDGMELLSKIKDDDRINSIPIIILVAEGDEKSIRKGKELGADSYLVKPFQPDELLAKVESLLKTGEKLYDNR